ncbi:hypothetical protein PR048_005091 [Dryococelus australis]|uniref:Uncharacterized protein n=1 Tax=Dryococelus australis TaxID=614101 RepID=A0ABQ9I8D3_9NEOP|nr:hypothetical protein PR048_005091 [Dryococelus australis]
MSQQARSRQPSLEEVLKANVTWDSDKRATKKLNDKNYLSLTIHYVRQQCKYNSHTLNVKHFPESHTAENIRGFAENFDG